MQYIANTLDRNGEYMDIKLVAIDLDRTTLNSEGHLSEANRKAILSAIEKGVHVCIASGRAFDTLPKEVIDIPGIEYAITSNGAAIYRIEDKECMRSFVLKPESVEKIMEMTKGYPVTYEAFIKGTAYCGKEYINNPVKYGATPHSLNYVKSTRIVKEDITAFIMQHKHELDSIDIVINDTPIKEKIIKMLRESLDDIYITSSIKQLIEISYKDAGKKSGLLFISELLSIPVEFTAAFGDADNDIDMVKFAGFGVAMANASDNLKSVADYITLTNDEDGLSHAFKNVLKISD